MKMRNKFIQLFHDKSFDQKKRPLREAGGQKKTGFAKKLSKARIQIVSAKKTLKSCHWGLSGNVLIGLGKGLF